jgi:hypothetical protein
MPDRFFILNSLQIFLFRHVEFLELQEKTQRRAIRKKKCYFFKIKMMFFFLHTTVFLTSELCLLINSSILEVVWGKSPL